MKRLFVSAVAASAAFHGYAIDGHNGIQFNMTQRQVEAMGFVCTDHKIGEGTIALCKHIEMTGTAFGVRTENYRVTIGADNQVSDIAADLVGIRTLPEYLHLLIKVQDFFPTKDEAGTHSAEGVYMRDAWRALDDSGASLFYFSGIRGVAKDTMSVRFSSPKAMAAVDRLRADRQSKKTSESEADSQAPGETEGDKESASMYRFEKAKK